MPKVSVLGLAPILIWLVAACGGDGPEPVSLDEYFSQIDAIFKEQERRSEVIGEAFNDRLNIDAASVEEALEAAAELLPELFDEIRPVFEDAIKALSEIEPPVEVAESHEAMLEAYLDLLAFFVELDDGLENEESVEAALAALFTDASANEISQRLETALNDLQAIADANNIEVDLPNTGGDISGSDQAPRPGDPPAARTPENTPRLVETEDRDGPNVVESGGRGSQIAIETIQYESTEFGFSFLYQVAPDEFVFREIRVADVELAAIWLLTRREALEGTLSESEGPPGIRIDVRVISPPPASAEDWVRNSSASNFALGSGEVTDATVGGHEAVAYSWSGLYEARSVVVLVDGRVWSFTVTSSGDFSEIEAAFNDLLRSVIFIQQ